MKADILSLDGKKLRQIELPEQFHEEYRNDLIKRSILAIFSQERQRYGVYYRAGKGSAAKLSRRRRAYKGAYGHALSRIPRKTMWKRGTQFGWVGAWAPGTVGGRKSHPPKAEKIFAVKINQKEMKKALRSVLSFVASKGKLIILEKKFEDLIKIKEVENVFKNLKLEQALERAKERKVRGGKGKLRGRRYKKKLGPLIIVNDVCNLVKSARNLAGVDIVEIKNLKTTSVVGGTSGKEIPRDVIITEDAIAKMKDERLFI